MGQGCVSLSSGGGSGAQTSGPAGVFVSEDKGENWKQVSQLPTLEGVKTLSQVSVYRLVNDPQDDKAMYWLSRGHGLFYSYNNGKSWRAAEGKLSTGFIYAAAVHPENKCAIVATNGGEVYQSNDCGRTWEEIYRESRTDVRVNSLAYNPFRPYEIFMGESNGDLLESDDNGVAWQVVHRFKSGVAQVETDPISEGVLYAATRKHGLHRSEDGGVTWISTKDALDEFPDANEYRRFVIHPEKTNILYWISTYGILVSGDRGDTWNPINLITPPGSAQIYGFAVNPNNERELYYTATINNRSTFYTSMDGGQRWKTNKLPSGQLPTVIRVDPETDTTIYIGFTIPPRGTKI